MAEEEDSSSRGRNQKSPSSQQHSTQSGYKSWFATPAPIKRLFDTFPLTTYPPNELPRRRDSVRARHTLYIFATQESAETGTPSFNPSCLKWQAYLRFLGIDFAVVPSNNHASPTGALPFLLVSTQSSDPLEAPTIVPSTKLQRWAQTSKDVAREEPSSIRYDAYMALLDHRIRNAWLYTLYLTPSNFRSVAQRFYIAPTSSNPFVRLTLSFQLRRAAMTELLKQSPVVDVQAILREAEKAFEALSELLGDDEYFFSQEEPGLFDASVFAYTHLLLDENLGWSPRMLEGLIIHENLIEHRNRLLAIYFWQAL